MASDEVVWGTIDELYQHLFKTLEPLPIDDVDALIEAIEPHLEPYEPQLEETERGVNRDPIGKQYYAIHNNDLRYMFLVGGMIAGVMSAGSSSLSYIGSIVGLGIQYRRKRIELTALQGVVLKALLDSDAEDGLDASTLSTHLPSELELDADQITEILTELTSIKRTNGERTRLVDREGELWWTVDL